VRTFNKGDVAFVVDREGVERQVSVLGRESEGSYFVAWMHQTGSPFHVAIGKLLAPKAPFFHIRGQVLTTSSSHPCEVGQIVGTATSKSGKTFFNICFDDGTSEWFNEDQVFIDDEVKRAYDETTKDGEFFK
jgi:hypothetical protein